MNLGDPRSYRKLKNGVLFKDRINAVRVTASDPGIWRVQVLFNGREDSCPDFGFVREITPNGKVTFRDNYKNVELFCDSLPRIRIQKKGGQIHFLTDGGAPVISTHPQHTISKDQRSGQVRAYFTRARDDIYFGLGEKSGSLVKNGRTYFFGACDAAGYESEFHDPLYKNIPFLLTGNNKTGRFWGIFFRTAWEGHINLGSTIDNYYAPDFHVVFDGGPLDFYFLDGPKPPDVLERFTRLTGRTVLPPKYTLGYLASAFQPTEMPHASDQVLGFARKCRSLKIPCDGWHLSSGYTAGHDGKKRYVFHWNKKRFPDPKNFCEKMHSLGFRIAANVKPALLISHPKYNSAAKKGLFIKDKSGKKPLLTPFWGGMGSFIDFTNPSVCQWWRKNIIRNLLKPGVDGIWNDNCEYSIYDKEALCHGENKAYPATGLKTVQTNLMVRSSRDAIQIYNGKKRPWVVSRAGWAGLQSLAQTWSGDNTTSWHELKWNIPVGLGMGLSGVANESHDIGGFCGPKTDPELFLRWCQCGIFMPRFTIHSGGGIMEPWTFPKALPLVREAIRFRYRLIPLLYSLFDEAQLNGAPVQRPMLWNFPEQTQLWEESFQFMLGEFLLVSPVTEPSVSAWNVRLPAGHLWMDWFTGKCYSGGKTVSVPAPLNRFVLLMRDGAIVPSQKTVQCIGSMCITDLELHLILPQKDQSSFNLYEDDGESMDYQKGSYHRRKISLSRASRRSAILSFHSPEGAYIPSWKSVTLIFRENIRKIEGNHESKRPVPIRRKDGWTTASIPYPQGSADYNILCD